MAQLELRLMARLDGPSVVPYSEIAKIKTYREAVVMAWVHRRIKKMTKAALCVYTGMRPSHLNDYLSIEELDKRGKERRDMPAKYIPKFELAMGNTFVSQWLAMQSKLTVMEGMAAEQLDAA